MAPRLLSCFGRARGASKSISGDHDDTTENSADPTAEEQRRCGPVLVELFSSQGCATSPGAEAIAARIGRGHLGLDVAVAVLVFHVEHWDYMGWKDPFGSSMWTVRQKSYAESLRLDTLYTPQAVVNGRVEVMGNEEEKIVEAIRAAQRFPSPTMQATFSKPSPSTLKVSLSGALRNKVDSSGVDVMVALYECGLVTNCTAGENKDRVLSNDFVVRRLEKMATVKDMAPKKNLTGDVTFELWEGFNPANCGILLFLQNGSYHTFGTKQFQIPPVDHTPL